MKGEEYCRIIIQQAGMAIQTSHCHKKMLQEKQHKESLSEPDDKNMLKLLLGEQPTKSLCECENDK